MSTNLIVSTLHLTGTVQTFTAPVSGWYSIVCYGGSGYDTHNDSGGCTDAGKSSGIVYLDVATKLSVYVGGAADTHCRGGWNGGGDAAVIDFRGGGTDGAGGGGGATDVRIYGESLYNRIIIAGGSGGSDNLASDGTPDGYPGRGGGLIGENGKGPKGLEWAGAGGTQTFGYALGQGGKGGGLWDSGGGGGGYYGGYGAKNHTSGGGGGSAYVSGMPGCSVNHTGITFKSGYTVLGGKPYYQYNRAGFCQILLTD